MGKWKKDRSKFDGFEIQTNAYPKDEKLFIPYREIIFHMNYKYTLRTFTPKPHLK